MTTNVSYLFSSKPTPTTWADKSLPVRASSDSNSEEGYEIKLDATAGYPGQSAI
jgi:hypothetical protein